MVIDTLGPPLTGWPADALIAGHPGLDFLNTTGGHTRSREGERLSCFGDVARWGLAAGLLDANEAAGLSDLAALRPAEAEAALAALRHQREAVHGFLTALLADAKPPAAVRQRVEHDFRVAYVIARLDPRQPGGWRVGIADSGLDLPAHRIALASAALLASEAWRHIRMCQACSWLFLDLTPTKRRRWCSMAACGNRAKARRHYHAVGVRDIAG